MGTLDNGFSGSVSGTTSVTKPNVYYGTTQFLYVYPGNYTSLSFNGTYAGWSSGCSIWKVKRDGTWSTTVTAAPADTIDLTDCIGLFATMYFSGTATVTLS